MPWFRISAAVTVDVVIEIEARDIEHAKELWHDNIAVEASMIELDPKNWMTTDDSIIEVENFFVERIEE
jgi:hypothetical protein